MVKTQPLLFLLFLLAGASSVCCNFAARIIFQYIFSYSFSVVLGYLVGMATAYLLFKALFGNQRTQFKSIRRFILVNLYGMTQTYVFSMVFLKVLGQFLSQNHAENLAHLLALSMLSITSYLMHKHYTFQQKKA